MNYNIKYLKLIKQVYTERKTRNKKYSLRAFARDLDIPVSSLSELLSGKSGISKERAIKVADKLNLSIKEKNIKKNDKKNEPIMYPPYSILLTFVGEIIIYSTSKRVCKSDSSNKNISICIEICICYIVGCFFLV